MPYLQRERHRIVDETVGDCLEAIRVPQIAQSLGDYAVTLTRLLSDVTVPNVRHGELVMHADCFTKTPILAVSVDERLHWLGRSLAMHEQQERAIYDAFHEETARLIVEHSWPRGEGIEDERLPIASIADRGSMAYVGYRTAPLETNLGEYVAFSSPVAFIDAWQPCHRAPNVLMHELTHIEQLYRRPLLTPDERFEDWVLENELETYHVEAQAMYGYHAAGQWGLLLEQTGPGERSLVALEIDTIRRRHMTNPDDPFWPTKAMKRILRQRNIPIV